MHVRLREPILAFESELEELPGVTLAQAQALLNLSEPETLRLLRKLEREGRLTRERFSVRSVPELSGPLWSSASGEVFNATRLESRIRGRYGEPQHVWAWSLHGVKRPLQIDHEIALSSVRVWYAKNRPDFRWVGERPRRGGLVPDATVIGPHGPVTVELVGQYRSPALREIFTHYQEEAQKVPLELW